MAHAITAVENDAGSLAPRIQTEHSLLLEEDLWRAKLFKKLVFVANRNFWRQHIQVGKSLKSAQIAIFGRSFERPRNF